METLLRQCLNSVCICDASLEVLVIIDGATDRSSDIAHEYETLHPETFRVIDKENGNYGSCINRGLKEAKGKYVKILDADDTLDTKSLPCLLKVLQREDVDLVITNYSLCNTDGNILEQKTFNLPVGVQLSAEALSSVGAHMAMHAVIYKTKNLLKIAYKQTEGISYTDQEWIYRPMTSVKSFMYTDINLYKYTIGRVGQTMDSLSIFRNIHHNLVVMRSMIDTFNVANEKDAIYGYLKNRLECYAEYVYSLYLYNTKETDVKALISFDKSLKTFCPKLYKYIGSLHAGKLPFIKLWRFFYYSNDYGINNFFRNRRYRPQCMK